MNARTISPASPQAAPAPPRFDRKFIEDHHLIERYLQSKLPFKGARDLENWCRAHPEYLNELKLSERAHTSLKLLEASGQPMDLREPPPPWWKTVYVLIGLSALAFICLVAFWVMLGKYALLRGELADTRTLMNQGSLIQPAAESSLRVTPDRVFGIDRARVVLNHGEPQLMDLHIDMNYTNKLAQFRIESLGLILGVGDFVAVNRQQVLHAVLLSICWRLRASCSWPRARLCALGVHFASLAAMRA